jgi:O-antigen/teichoic acid export membrane protein
MFFGLFSLWSPVFMGILQGRQNFFWLGNASILNGATRFVAAIIFVAILAMNSTGAMLAAVVGMAVAMVIATWQIRDVFAGPASQFDWRSWLKRATPVTLGYGAATFILSSDMIIVQKFFPDANQNGIYGAAGTIGRAVFFFLAPMTTVMFPKVAQSAARSQNSNVLAQALGTTALMGVAAALCCTFFAELPFRIGYKPQYASAAKLLPVFAWCMLPLPLANVLVNNLLARERYGIVPWLAGIAIAYYFALAHVARLQPQRFENIIYTLGAFGLLLLVVCLIYTLQDIRRLKPPIAPLNA